MRIKSHTLVLSSLLVGLALVSAVVFAARNWTASPATVGTIASSAPASADASSKPPSKDASTLTSVPEAWGFSLALPEGWTIRAAADGQLDEDARVRGWIMSGVPTSTGGADLNVSTVTVRDVAKDGRTFDEVANAYVWTDADVQEIVSFMQSEASDLFPDFSAEDVLVASAPDAIGGAAAIRATEQCLKPCYIEGGAATTVRYIVDAENVVYLFDVTVGTSTKAADLLNAADAVIRTFTLN